MAKTVPEHPLLAALDLTVLERTPEGLDALRDVLLDLAVRGALVPQQDADGSGAELLKKHTRGAGAAGDSAETAPPFSIPATWCWAHLSELGRFVGGGTPAKSNAAFWDGPIPWVSPKDMKRPFISDSEDHISEAALEASAAKLIPAPSALFVLRGMILAHSFPVAITTREVTINQDMRALVLDEPALAPFLLRVLQAARRRVLAHVERSSHGTCRLDSAVVENLLVPIPPLKEQKRIVAKVDQLMALCDELEAKQAKKRDVGDRLTKAALAALTSAATRAEVISAWTKVSDVVPALLDAPEAADALYWAVLDLAVTGKLATNGPWPTKTVEECADVIVDCPHSTPKFTPTGFGCIDTTCIRPELIRLDRMRSVDTQTFHERNRRLVPREGDIVFAREASVGTAVVLPREPAVCLGQRVMLIRPASDYVVPKFLELALMAPTTRAQYQPLLLGSTVPHLNVRDVRALKVPSPTVEEQRKVVAFLGVVRALTGDFRNELERRLNASSRLSASLAVAAVSRSS